MHSIIRVVVQNKSQGQRYAIRDLSIICINMYKHRPFCNSKPLKILWLLEKIVFSTGLWPSGGIYIPPDGQVPV